MFEKKGTTRSNRFDQAVTGRRSRDKVKTGNKNFEKTINSNRLNESTETAKRAIESSERDERGLENKYFKGPLIVVIVLVAIIIISRSFDYEQVTRQMAQFVEEANDEPITIAVTEETMEDEVNEELTELEAVLDEVLLGDIVYYEGYLKLGISMIEVTDILGEPTEIREDDNGKEFWLYDLGVEGEYLPSITFTYNGLVDGWYNYEDKFDEVMQGPSDTNDNIAIGTSREKVFEIIGTPDYIEHMKPSFLWYDSMYIELDESGNVGGWRSLDSNYIGYFQGHISYGEIELGLTTEEVMDVLGAPSDIELDRQHIWFYDDSSITYDETMHVNGWFDNGEFAQSRSGGEIELSYFYVGMTQMVVTEVYGTPRYIDADEPNLWSYDGFYVEFDDSKTVSFWGEWQ